MWLLVFVTLTLNGPISISMESYEACKVAADTLIKEHKDFRWARCLNTKTGEWK